MKTYKQHREKVKKDPWEIWRKATEQQKLDALYRYFFNEPHHKTDNQPRPI